MNGLGFNPEDAPNFPRGPAQPVTSPKRATRSADERASNGNRITGREPPGSDGTGNRSGGDVVRNGGTPGGARQPEEHHEPAHVVPVVTPGVCRDHPVVALARRREASVCAVLHDVLHVGSRAAGGRSSLGR